MGQKLRIQTFKKTCYVFCHIVLGLLALALIFATVIPLLRSDAWWIRIFDFPRIQFTVLMVLTLAGYIVLHFWRKLRPWEYGLAAAAAIALIWQLIAIAPYTALYPTEMTDSDADDDTNRISLLVYNVLYKNRQVAALRNLIRETDPDLILLNEPTSWWLEQLVGLEDNYPYTLYQPQDNHYGMLLYSRLKLVNPEIRFLIESEIPSVRSQVQLRSGELITLYGLHPRPPGLDLPDYRQDEREDSDMRDAELMLVAKEIKQLGDVPVIVAGDFNDVAWSRTTHLFQRVGGLLDPRVGRGLFNTFDTRSRLLRYPLDHAFASKHFLLVELQLLPDIGSDHFPFLVVLDYDSDATVVNEEPKPEAGDKQKTEKAIKKGKTEDQENQSR